MALPLLHCLLTLLQWLNFEQRVNEDIYWLLVFHEWKVLSYERLEIIFTFSMFPSWIICSSHWDSNWRFIVYLHYIFTISLAVIMARHLLIRVHSGVQVSKCLHIKCSLSCRIYTLWQIVWLVVARMFVVNWSSLHHFILSFFILVSSILCLMERKNK